MKKILILLVGVGIGMASAKKVEKLSKKYRLVIKLERRDEK